MNWIHLGLVLALVAGTSGTALTAAARIAMSPTVTAVELTLPPKARTGFNCLFATTDRWEPCSNYKLEANI